MTEPVDISAAPRPVPWSLGQYLRFGGTVGIIGWTFLAMGLAFTFGFGALMHPMVAIDLAVRTTATTTGVVTDWAETSASVNEQPVIATLFDYTVDGEPYAGASFAVDAAREIGSTVEVQYVVDDPRSSRIVGMMVGEAPWWVLLILLIFPLVGFGLALSRFRRGHREVRVLRHGRPTRGVSIGRAPTGVSVNDVPEYAVTFEFRDHLDRRFEVVSKTLEPDDLLDDAHEALLYLPEDPEQAVLLDSAPGIIELDPTGRLRPVRLGALLGALIPQTLTVAVVALAAILL